MAVHGIADADLPDPRCLPRLRPQNRPEDDGEQAALRTEKPHNRL